MAGKKGDTKEKEKRGGMRTRANGRVPQDKET